ncbi:MAG: zinc ribbon domain-containing protein [Promethearchaeota archaeon]|nr:MAG: zinc ribbon domain-containing protein [Candidatus Lokiarchaeota archaeon]
MNLNNCRLAIFFIVLGMIIPFYNGVTEYSPMEDFDKLQEVNSSQNSNNQTVSIFLPKLIWWEGSLQLEIISNQTGQINCFLREVSGNSSYLNETINISNLNQTYTIMLKFYPDITTFPGVYIFRLNLTGIITYYEEFDVILGLGFIPSIVIFGTGLVFIFYILVKKTKKSEKIQDSSVVIDSTGSLIGKISCPNCRKQIQEGLTFCPECGERIPEFLRYNSV